MTTQPTPLPPTVADLFKNLHTADDVIEQLGFEMNHGYLSPKNRAIVEAAQDRVRALASRAADPAPVADEAAIAAWDKAMNEANNSGKPGEIDRLRREGKRLMRAAPRNDDNLRKIKAFSDAQKAEIERCGGISHEYLHGQRNLLGLLDYEIDRLLAESPAGDAGESGSRKIAFDPHGVAGKLRLIASGLTYNEGKAEGVAKHWIYEVAWRIQAGLDHVPDEKRMRGEINDLRETVSAQQQTIDSVIVACGSLGLSASVLPAHIEGLRARLQAVEAERDEKYDELTDVRAERDKLAADLAAAQKERDEAAARWKSVSDKLVDSWVERDKLAAESPAGDAVGLFGDDKLRSEIAAKWGHAGAHVEVFDDLRARLQAAEADLAAAKSIYREHWDDCETVAEMMRSACNEAVTRLAQFKDRGGLIDKLEADLAAAQRERDDLHEINDNVNAELERKEAELTAACAAGKALQDENEKLKGDLVAAKAEGARAVDALQWLHDRFGSLSWGSYSNPAIVVGKKIAALRAAHPQPTPTTAAPATTMPPQPVEKRDGVLWRESERMHDYGCDTHEWGEAVERLLDELCRRALEGKP